MDEAPGDTSWRRHKVDEEPSILEMSERCGYLAYYTGSDLRDILLRIAHEALSCAHDEERNQPVQFDDLHRAYKELEDLL